MKNKMSNDLTIQQCALSLFGIVIFMLPYAAFWSLLKGGYSFSEIYFQNVELGFSDIINSDFYKKTILILIICFMFCGILSTQLAFVILGFCSYYNKALH